MVRPVSNRFIKHTLYAASYPSVTRRCDFNVQIQILYQCIMKTSTVLSAGSLKGYISPRSSRHAPVVAPAMPPSLAYLAAGAPQQPPWFISNAIRSPYDTERLVEAVKRELRVMQRR